MKAELWYAVVVRDRSGKVLSRFRRKSRSFVKQWNQVIYRQTSNVNINVTDIGGVARSMTYDVNLLMKAAAGEINYGIVVGTGDTAVVIGDYSLETRIAEGAGGGQLNYTASTVAVSVVSAPTCGFLLSRSAVNNSGVLITVKESGIYWRYKEFATWYYFLAVRDVFGAPQDVPDGGSITVNYTLRVSV